MEKGFYLLQPEKVKYFESLLEAIDTIEKCGMWVCFLTERTNTEGEKVVIPFSVWFKIVENEKEFFVRMRTRILVKGSKLSSDKLVPSSKNNPKEFFASIRNYLDQKLKKERLTSLLGLGGMMEERINKVLMRIGYSRFVDSPDSDVFISVIIDIKNHPGFEWVEENHFLEVMKELYGNVRRY